jgi:outer membrane protein assembly factor BamB
MRLAILVALAASPALAGDWPAFRGGGLATPPTKGELATLPESWDGKANVLWSVTLPEGWSSPVVAGGKVFVTAASGGKLAEPRKGLYIEDLKGKAPEGEHEWQVICLDAATGKELWRKSPFQGKLGSTIHIKNSLASETPVAADGHVYSVFGNVGVACHTLDGKEVWRLKLPARKTQMGWGTGASPAYADGKLILVNDNEEESYIEALDGKTGKSVWKVKRDETSNWATPFVWRHEGRTEVVTAGKGKVRSYSLDGKLLWELRGMSTIAIPTPFAAEGLLFVTSGYILDPVQRPLYAIKPGAKGDITLKSGQKSNDHVAWVQWFAGPYHPTPVAYEGHVYVLLDRGFLSCYEAKTGKAVYEKKRLGGAAFTASPWAYGGRVYCLSEDGETWAVKAGPEFGVVGRSKLGEMALATPAVAGGSVFLRTRTKLWCLRKSG